MLAFDALAFLLLGYTAGHALGWDRGIEYIAGLQEVVAEHEEAVPTEEETRLAIRAHTRCAINHIEEIAALDATLADDSDAPDLSGLGATRHELVALYTQLGGEMPLTDTPEETPT